MLLFLLVSSAIVVSFVLWEADIKEFVEKSIRYADSNIPLVALILFLTLASDVFLPVPSVLVGGMCGLLLGVVPGFLTAFLALSASSATGYAIGRKSERLARRFLGDEEMALLSDIHRRGGPLLLLGLRPVPVLSEASMVFAGMAKTPVGKTALLVSLGNAAVAGVYVVMGAVSRSFNDLTLPILAVCLVLSGVLMLVAKLKR